MDSALGTILFQAREGPPRILESGSYGATPALVQPDAGRVGRVRRSLELHSEQLSSPPSSASASASRSLPTLLSSRSVFVPQQKVPTGEGPTAAPHSVPAFFNLMNL